MPGAEADTEEERRLFYVGLTRAKESLMILKYSDCYMPFVYLMEKILRKTRPGRSIYETSVNMELEPGDVIIHKSFGTGMVMSVEGDTVTAVFGSGRRVLSYGFCISHGMIRKEEL
jgi:DNA helicase II / ATP-dependent DNA helicase PcrA